MGEFYALDSACSHEGCTVPILDPTCDTCSAFVMVHNIASTALSNAVRPAFLSANSPCTAEGSDLLPIELPDISFALRRSGCSAPAGARLQIEFDAFEQIDYQIYFRPDTRTDWNRASPLCPQRARTGRSDLVERGGECGANLHRERGRGWAYTPW